MERALVAPEQLRTEPALQAAGLADDTRKGDKLWLDARPAAQANQSQEKLKVGAARLIREHLHFINDNGASLRENMRIGEGDGSELFVG